MTSYAVAQEDKFLLGDVNGDGVVNITDVIYLVNYIMQPESTTIILKAADVNIDGNINILQLNRWLSMR